jgi:hypothetical protein
MLSSAASVMTGCSAWALCNIVWGLAKMQLDWNMFPRPFRDALMFNVRRLETEMNSVDVGILVWSLGVCICVYVYMYVCIYIYVFIYI